VDVHVPPTLADGLAGQIDDAGFAIGQFALDDMRVVSEEQIAHAIALLASEHDARVEGSGAVGAALILSRQLGTVDGPVVVVLSGGNIDDARWQKIRRGDTVRRQLGR
jgi:threonine dehydratase